MKDTDLCKFNFFLYPSFRPMNYEALFIYFIFLSLRASGVGCTE